MNNYLEVLAENGRKGGIQKGLNYKKYIAKVIELFIADRHLTQKDIAIKVGVSQAFVSKHTNYDCLKIERLERGDNSNLTNIELEKILLKINLEKNLKYVKQTEEYEIIQKHKKIIKI
jgi:predicted XRE-type DNA-binding protein